MLQSRKLMGHATHLEHATCNGIDMVDCASFFFSPFIQLCGPWTSHKTTWASRSSLTSCNVLRMKENQSSVAQDSASHKAWSVCLFGRTSGWKQQDYLARQSAAWGCWYLKESRRYCMHVSWISRLGMFHGWIQAYWKSPVLHSGLLWWKFKRWNGMATEIQRLLWDRWKHNYNLQTTVNNNKLWMSRNWKDGTAVRFEQLQRFSGWS